VIENPLVVPVSDGRQADGLAVDGDGVLPVRGADGGLGAGLVGGHLPNIRGDDSLARWPPELHGKPHQRLGEPVFRGERRVGYARTQRCAAAEHPVQRATGRLEFDVQRRNAFRRAPVSVALLLPGGPPIQSPADVGVRPRFAARPERSADETPSP
jgi:hypothetical protein